MAKLMIRSKNPTDWTVAMGLFNLVQRTLVGDYFSVFCAGGIIVAIPISILFLRCRSSMLMELQVER